MTPAEVISVFFEDFVTEVNDFSISITLISASKILNHTGRPQEVFEKEINDGKAKIVGFEILWDTELTMEKVCKVIKSIPSSLQSQGFLEIAGIVACNSSYYSSITKAQEL